MNNSLIYYIFTSTFLHFVSDIIKFQFPSRSDIWLHWLFILYRYVIITMLLCNIIESVLNSNCLIVRFHVRIFLFFVYICVVIYSIKHFIVFLGRLGFAVIWSRQNHTGIQSKIVTCLVSSSDITTTTYT